MRRLLTVLLIALGGRTGYTQPVDAPEPTVEPAPEKPHAKHAHADADASGPTADAPVAVPEVKSEVKPEVKKKRADSRSDELAHPHGEVELAGRVFARTAVSKEVDDPEARGHSSLVSARAGLDYRYKKQIHAQLEVELAGKARIKDAYVQLRLADGTPKLHVRAGNFKMPFSAIQMTSIWTLPMADRGLLDNMLVDRLQVAGRAVGANVIVAIPEAWHAELRAGAFQGVDDAGNPITANATDRFGQDGVARVTVEPVEGLAIGSSFTMRVGQLLVIPAVVRRGWASDLDATLVHAAGPGQIRLWVEGMVGTSWLVADMTRSKATFTEGRAIAAYRFGGATEGKRYLEPYALAGMLDPDAKIRADVALETTGGITYGAADRWRVQAEIERWKIGANAPVGIAELGVAPTTSTTFLVQLGARL